jgi:hypothetical protein
MSTVHAGHNLHFKICSFYHNCNNYFPDAAMADIIETNLGHIIVKLGESLNMTCRSAGRPEPKTLWYKVNIQMPIPSKHFFHYSILISLNDIMQSPTAVT